MSELGIGQAARQSTILLPVPLLVHQQGEAFLETELGHVGLPGLGAEGFGHAHQAQGLQLLQGGLIQHKRSSAEAAGSA